MRVLVCGGRDYADRAKLDSVLSRMIGCAGHPDLTPDTIIVGCAKGADTLAEQWADKAGHRVERYPADWEKHGKAAGLLRNQRMIEEGKPNLVIAFPGGRGTADMIARAEKAGVAVHRVT
jgi:hypothetical protein